jgi:hypothetical protein
MKERTSGFGDDVGRTDPKSPGPVVRTKTTRNASYAQAFMQGSGLSGFESRERNIPLDIRILRSIHLELKFQTLQE